MGKLFMLMGCPGAGKSTWCKKVMLLEDKYISRDDIRFSLVKENEEYFSREKEVFKEFVNRINEDLKNYNVFADATHLNAASRNKLLRVVSTKPESIELIWIKVPLEVAIQQNENRRETRSYVPVEQIKRMYNSIEIPDLEEGFNRIYIVEKDKKMIVKERV